MPLDRPSLVAIRTRIEKDIGGRLPGIDPLLRRSLVDVFGKALAGAVHEVYGQLETVSRDVFPDTAEASALERWGSIYEVGRDQADFATGDLDVTGDVGAIVPAGTRFIRGNGVELESTAPVVLGGLGTGVVPVEAVVAGAAGNAEAGALLSLVSPLAGVDTTATVAAGGITGGLDADDDDDLRDALLDEMAFRSQGGNQDDYERWALEVPGVTRRWVVSPDPGDASPLVSVLFVLDEDPVSIVPDAGDLAAMQALLDSRRALAQRPLAVAPTLVPLDLEISNLSPDTPEVQAAVEASFADMIFRDARPGSPILLSHIRESISLATGEDDHVVVSPVANVPHASTELPVPGVVTFS